MSLFPLKGINHLVNVLADVINDGLHGIVVGQEVEIQGASDEIACAVGQVELHWRGHTFAVHLDEHAVNVMFFIDNQAVAYAVGFLDVLGQRYGCLPGIRLSSREHLCASGGLIL